MGTDLEATVFAVTFKYQDTEHQAVLTKERVGKLPRGNELLAAIQQSRWLNGPHTSIPEWVVATAAAIGTGFGIGLMISWLAGLPALG